LRHLFARYFVHTIKSSHKNRRINIYNSRVMMMGASFYFKIYAFKIRAMFRIKAIHMIQNESITKLAALLYGSGSGGGVVLVVLVVVSTNMASILSMSIKSPSFSTCISTSNCMRKKTVNEILKL